MRTKDTVLLEEAYASVINEASKKGKKPDWLLAAELKAEAKQGKGVSKCPDCGCNPSKPKAGCKCKHKNKKQVDENAFQDDEEEIMNAVDHHIAHDSPKWQAIYDILAPFDIDNKMDIIDQIAALRD
jgi:hypothetical protein